MSANGFMSVTWNYTHTGGLPLTSVSVSYTKQVEGLNITHPTPLTVNEVESTSVVDQNLEAGFEYLFNITAMNDHDSSTILCGPTLHAYGKTSVITIDTATEGIANMYLYYIN